MLTRNDCLILLAELKEHGIETDQQLHELIKAVAILTFP